MVQVGKHKHPTNVGPMKPPILLKSTSRGGPAVGTNIKERRFRDEDEDDD